MLSKEMYVLLKQIPRYDKQIAYAELNSKNKEHLLCEAKYDTYDYINQSGILLKDSKFSLTEKGQAAIEEYEKAKKNWTISVIALIVSILSIVLSLCCR